MSGLFAVYWIKNIDIGIGIGLMSMLNSFPLWAKSWMLILRGLCVKRAERLSNGRTK